MRQAPALAAVVLVLVVVCTSAFGAAGGATIAHDGQGANHTVTLSGERAQYPRATNVTAEHSLVLGDLLEGTGSPEGYEDLDHVIVHRYHFDFQACTRETTTTFGIDRGNNDTGTTVDTDLRPLVKTYDANPDELLLDLTDDRDLGGYAPPLNATDQLVVVARDCYTMPDEPGWYQLRITLGGTGYDGDTMGASRPIESHYVHVCACRNRSEAESVLGPPPSERDGEVTPGPTPKEPLTPTPTTGPRPTIEGTTTVTVGELPNSTASPRSPPSPSPIPTARPSPTPVDGWRGAVAGVPPTTAAGGVLVAIGLVLYGLARLVWE